MRALVTGFAGSIGSEFVRRLLSMGYQVTGIDNAEWPVAAFPDLPGLTKRLGDFANVSGTYDLLVHCAAYKHVDLIESNTTEAMANNYHKTTYLWRNVNAPTKLLISTDKAVEPSSFYGNTKRLAEEYALIDGGTVARLGNVLGSSGSVIPRWEAALDAGEPLPVTDFRMGRYMLPVDLAVSRVLSLLPKASEGDVIVPEMGDEISISSLMETVLEARGLTIGGPEPYPVVEIGMRPGEKLHEKLTWDEEHVIYRDENGIIVRR